MMQVECYEVRYMVCGTNFFNGGNGPAAEVETECFATEEEAIKARNEKMEYVAKRMAWCKWWVEKYIKEENYTVKKVVKTI